MIQQNILEGMSERDLYALLTSITSVLNTKGAYIPQTKMEPLESAAESYLDARLASNCRKATMTLYRLIIGRFVEYSKLQGIRFTYQIEPKHAVGYLAKRLSMGRQSTTVKTERACVLGFLLWLTDNGLCNDLQWGKRVQKIKQDKKTPRCLSADECERILKASETLSATREEKLSRLRDPALIAVLLDTGLRVGELLGMNIGDIDQERRQIHVTSTAKARRERVVWYGNRTAALLAEYLKLREKAGKSEPVWVSRCHKRLTNVRVHFIVKEVAEEAGIYGVHVHTFRHSCATALIRNGMSVKAAQMFLGHSDIQMTDHYTHLTTADIQESYTAASPVDRISI